MQNKTVQLLTAVDLGSKHTFLFFQTCKVATEILKSQNIVKL